MGTESYEFCLQLFFVYLHFYRRILFNVCLRVQGELFRMLQHNTWPGISFVWIVAR